MLVERSYNIFQDLADTKISRRQLNPAEMKYNAFGRKLLEAYSAINKFRFVIEERYFIPLTDYKPPTCALYSKSDN